MNAESHYQVEPFEAALQYFSGKQYRTFDYRDWLWNMDEPKICAEILKYARVLYASETSHCGIRAL